MRIIRQVVKLIITPSELKASCINSRGIGIALGINLEDKPELKKEIDTFVQKLMDILEKEIG